MQPDLIDNNKPPRVVADSSREAFERIKPTLNAREYQVFSALWVYCLRSGFADATGGELAAYMQLDRTQIRPRLTGLLLKKVIEKTPIRTSRFHGETRCHGHRPCVPLAAIERAQRQKAA